MGVLIKRDDRQRGGLDQCVESLVGLAQGLDTLLELSAAQEPVRLWH